MPSCSADFEKCSGWSFRIGCTRMICLMYTYSMIRRCVSYRVIGHLPCVLKLSGCVPFRLNAVLIARCAVNSISDASFRSEQLFIQSEIFPPFLQGYVHYRGHNSTPVITRYVKTRGLWSGSLLCGVMCADHGNSSRAAVWSDSALRGHPRSKDITTLRNWGSHSGVAENVTSWRLKALRASETWTVRDLNLYDTFLYWVLLQKANGDE